MRKTSSYSESRFRCRCSLLRSVVFYFLRKSDWQNSTSGFWWSQDEAKEISYVGLEDHFLYMNEVLEPKKKFQLLDKEMS